MNVYDSILSFHGTWRTYQARVLESAQRYLDDKKIHIVAAPGAGKTTIGIELIRRSGLPFRRKRIYPMISATQN